MTHRNSAFIIRVFRDRPLSFLIPTFKNKSLFYGKILTVNRLLTHVFYER